MRTHRIHCDWCGVNITEDLIVYKHTYLKPHATHEGARDTYDFCSDAHLVAWRDEAQMRKIAQDRTHRMVGPDEQAAAEYRQQLITEVDQRIAEALFGRRHPEEDNSQERPS